MVFRTTMKSKQTTAISMEMTVDQYDTDLRSPLRDLGFLEVSMERPSCAYKYLTTGWDFKEQSLGVCIGSRYEIPHRYYIDHYNPKFFLLLVISTHLLQPQHT